MAAIPNQIFWTVMPILPRELSEYQALNAPFMGNAAK
jgi:hypothetical protein